MEKRIIAFDIGDKRVGVAVSDPFNTFALPASTFFRTKNAEEDAEKLAALAREKEAGLIVCGLPFNFDGSESAQTVKTKKFAQLLEARTELPVVFEDERFTTMEAEDFTFRIRFMVSRCKKEKDMGRNCGFFKGRGREGRIEDDLDMLMGELEK